MSGKERIRDSDEAVISETKNNIPSRAEILQSIDVEIDNGRKDQQLRGWTSWAILGAIAVIIWSMLIVIEGARFSIYHIFLIFVILLVADDLIDLISGAITPIRSEPTTSTRFYRFSQILGANRLFLLCYFARSLTLSIMGFIFYYCVIRISAIMFVCYYGFTSFGAIVVFVLSFTRLPVSLQITNRWVSINKLIIVFIILIGYVNFWWKTKDILLMSEYKVGLLLAAFAFLLFRLVVSTHGSWLHLQLVALRRNFALGDIDSISALRQLDITLRGMEMSDILQHDLGEILRLIEIVQREVSGARKILDEADQSVMQKQKTISEMENLLQVIESSFSRFPDLVDALSLKVDRFSGRIQAIRILYPKTTKHTEGIVDKLGQEIAALKANWKKLKGNYDSMLNIIKGYCDHATKQ
ncbi:hypothetical protein ES705_24590 [subsurface metagenome]